MKLIRKLFLASIILSICSIAGVSVWADSNDVFTLTNSYVFYWFVSITSFLFSLSAYFLMYEKNMINYTKQNIKLSNLHMYTVSIFGTIYIIFWLGASASVASDLRYCLSIKNNFKNAYYYFNILYNYNYNCNGEIVSTVFGFFNFILWCVIVYYSGSFWYSVYKKSTNNDIELHQNIESLDINYVIQPVLETKTDTEESQPDLETKIDTEEFPSVMNIAPETFTQEVMESFPIISEKK